MVTSATQAPTAPTYAPINRVRPTERPTRIPTQATTVDPKSSVVAEENACIAFAKAFPKLQNITGL